MKIYYLNHDTNERTGAGRFYNDFSEAVKKAIPGVEIKALTTENFLYPNKFKLLLALPAIKRILNRCDVIHALDGWPYGVIAALVNKVLKNPLIITGIGTGAVKPLYSWWRRPILKWAYRQANQVVAVSNNTKMEIQKFLPDLKIEVINHGVDYEKYNPNNTNAYPNYPKETNICVFPGSHHSDRISEHSDCVKRPYILSVGALKKRKGYEFSIKAFAEIAPHFPDLKYVIVGSGSEKPNLQLLITNYQLQKRVIFLKNLSEEELISLYQNAELFILLPQDINKDIEGFGLVFLEAAASGLPVVATRETSAQDAVRDRKNGILVPTEDYRQAAVAIEKILSDEALKKSMSEESVKFAKEMSWDRVARLYADLYNSL